MNSSSFSELRKNTIIIAVSNLGSKAIGFILAPLYSYYLSTREYGTVDLISTTASLLLPFICFDIYEACFRYARDPDYDRKTVLSSSLVICFTETTCVLLLFALISITFHLPPVAFVCVISATIDAYYQVFVQYARGTARMVTFAFAGILHSVLLLGLNIVLMVLLHYGLTGWVYAFVISKLLTVIYLAVSIRVWDVFCISVVKPVFIREAIRYCLPLMPSASMWWIMNVSDRYAISLLVSVSATGIYAVSNKLPALLSVFENVFYQAWQTTAIEAKNSEDRDRTYSDVFFKYFQFLAIGVLAILTVLKPMILYLFAEAYHSAWECASILVVSVMVHALAGNLGTLYVVFKKTGGAFRTSAIGAAANIILNIIFVKLYGMNAAAWTTLAGYLVVLFLRWHDTQKFVNLSVPISGVCITLLLLTAQTVLYYVPGLISFSLRLMIFFAYAYVNRRIIFSMVRKR